MMLVAETCMILWCITLCVGKFEITSHWLNNKGDDSYVSYTTENTSSWWAAANTICTRSGGQLFVPVKQSSLDDLTNLLDENEVYWVGGLQYSSLIWRADASRYYRRLGSMPDAFSGHVTPSTIDDNSAFMCNVRCRNNATLFGLKGRSCYCLGDGSVLPNLNIRNSTTQTEIRCPGDYNELCGDDRRISVYAGDMTIISSNGTCGFVRKNYGKLLLHLDDDCTRKRFYAYKNQTGVTKRVSTLRCRGDVCVSDETYSFVDAERNTLGLLKVTDANRKNLVSAMNYNSYWIGLWRSQEWRWNNGNMIARNLSRNNLERRCLAVRRDDSGVDVDWYPCSDNHRAVCQANKSDNTEDDRGIYLGAAASIAAVLVLCLIIVVIHFKRKGLYCFKANGEMHHSRAIASLLPGPTNTVNTTDRHQMFRLEAGPGDGEPVYSVIDGPECQGSSDPYTGPYHHTRAAGVEDVEHNTTQQKQQVQRDDDTYNHICLCRK